MQHYSSGGAGISCAFQNHQSSAVKYLDIVSDSRLTSGNSGSLVSLRGVGAQIPMESLN